MGYESTQTFAGECQIDFAGITANTCENLFFAGFVFRALQESPRPTLSSVFRDYCQYVGLEYDREQYCRLDRRLRYYFGQLNLSINEGSGS